MYAVKGAWVGQTFALAKRNESEVRKSRIRRSKEERKALVETFIKKELVRFFFSRKESVSMPDSLELLRKNPVDVDTKANLHTIPGVNHVYKAWNCGHVPYSELWYQESNNGSFPSLNLTHKEVGGSFYTVREIVRDIIQENRVLGPAEFTLGEHPSDQVLDQDLLGSIAVDPNTYFTASPNENHHVHSNLQDTSDKMLSAQQHTRVEGELSGNGNALNGSQVDVRNKEFNEAYEKGNVINGSQVDETNQELVEAFSKGNLIHSSQVDEANKESVEASTPDFQVSESLATPEDVTQNLAVPKTNLSPVSVDVIVETFPLRSVTSSAIGTESSREFRGITNSPENATQNLGLHIGKKRSELESVELMKNSNIYDEKSVDDLGNTSASGNEEDGKNVGHISVKSTIQAALEEHVAHDNEICAGPQVEAPDQSNILTAKVIEQSQTISGAEAKIQDGFHDKTLTLNCTEESNTKEERLENLNERRVNGQLGGSSQKINPTLERINLESWDGKPKNSMKQEVNPIWAVFRAFVDAFVKFWSE